MNNTITLSTRCGQITGLDCGNYATYLGVPYATAERFAYAEPITRWEGTWDATRHGNVCVQKRVWYEHLEIPERKFYFREFREGQEFSYSEDCLNLNIFAPKKEGKHPVLVFIHGGGFDSGSNYDSAITGDAYAQKDVVFVSINYRVGVFGYLTHEDIKKTYGHEGNFGLHDQLTALQWIKENIADYHGDPDRITVMGQSAGAISIQYLCLSDKCRGLFQRAIMLSGGGLFPKFALPRQAETTREYWLDLMQTAGAKTLEEFKHMEAKEIFTAWEEVKSRRKDNMFNTMPVVDHDLIQAPIDELIRNPLPIDYMIGYTNNDMYAVLMGLIAHKYAKENDAYLYYFDIDAPGDDNNGAFHSADLRYVFGTLDQSHRPYRDSDRSVSRMMIDYICHFVATGDPNADGLPHWQKGGKKALHLTEHTDKIAMGRSQNVKLLINTITKGDPK